jgi:hypothetical protein
MIDSPIVFIVEHETTKKFHTVIVRKVPFMGMQLDSDPDRWKSMGHHTEGFVELEDAKKDVLNSCKILIDHNETVGEVRYDIESIGIWDGKDVPLINTLYNPKDFTLYEGSKDGK